MRAFGTTQAQTEKAWKQLRKWWESQITYNKDMAIQTIASASKMFIDAYDNFCMALVTKLAYTSMVEYLTMAVTMRSSLWELGFLFFEKNISHKQLV